MPELNFKPPVKRRGKPFFMLLATLMALLITSSPVTVSAFSRWRHNRMINSYEYKSQYGYWETLTLPEEFKLNSIHAAVLPTGKILLIAGSGNNQQNFNTWHNEGLISVLKTVVFDPSTNHIKLVDTPSDLFCAGHTLMQSGNLLIAGGTSGYELLPDKIVKPAGPMVIHNENPDDQVRTFKKGTIFTRPDGKQYQSVQEVVLEPAHKEDRGRGDVTIHASSTKVFVEALGEDDSFLSSTNEQYAVSGLTGIDTQNIYGQGGPMSRNKQDFRGDNKAYEFDPITETYVKVGDMKESRWYASLPVLTNGEILAVSGLDNTGIITETTEWYDTTAKTWSWGPNMALPTYPALFRTQNPDVLFYSGSSAGYGPADKGRLPGFWNVRTNEFTGVGGLRDLDILETSASVVLPPPKGSNNGTQSNKVMVAGGGGIGESELVTNRVDIIDLLASNPQFTPAADLPEALRYVNLTVTPWDEVFGTGGTADYRSKGNSYSYSSFSYNPTSNTYTQMADAEVGRGYHSGSLLLRDGRILVFGNDPLYSDKDNTTPGIFEQRLEIYTPPQFFRGQRPELAGPQSMEAARGASLNFTSPQNSTIKSARLIPPSSSTHVTNLEQRSVAAVVSHINHEVKIDLPADVNVLPNGWYMLFVVDADGRSSYAKMIHIVR